MIFSSRTDESTLLNPNEPLGSPCTVTSWTISALWTEEQPAWSKIDFNCSICSLLFGPEGHRRLFSFLRRHKRLVRLSAFLYNMSLVAVCATLIVERKVGTHLSGFVVLAGLPVHIQLVLCLNPTLVRLSSATSDFWFMAILMVALWSTVGVMMGGLRGLFLSVGAIATALIGGPLYDSYHYLCRSTALHLWSLVMAIIIYCILMASVLVKVFSGGTILRWPLGTRQLTGEDIVLNIAATLLIYFGRPLVRTVSYWRMRKKDQGFRAYSSGPAIKTKRIQCSALSWPLIIEETMAAQRRLTSLSEARESPQQEQTQQLCCDSIGHKDPLQAVVLLDVSKPFVHTSISAASLFSNCHWLVKGVRKREQKRGPGLPSPPPPLEIGCHSRTSNRHTLVTPWAEVQQGAMDGPSTAVHHHQYRVGAEQRRASLLRILICLDVVLIPLSLNLGELRRDFPDCSLLGVFSPLVASLSLTGSFAIAIYLTTMWNYDVLCLMLRSSFDIWFLIAQAMALLFSLSDAFEYDERCISLTAWCILFVSSLCSDSILRRASNAQAGGKASVITKRFIGGGVLLPLLATHCWFLYNLVFRSGSSHLRFRVALHITKYLENEAPLLAGTEKGAGSAQGFLPPSSLDVTTDSFIIGRMSSILLFSLPFLYHLLTASTKRQSKPRLLAPNPGGSRRSTIVIHARGGFGIAAKNQQAEPSTEDGVLYFLTGLVSYEVPTSSRTSRAKVSPGEVEPQGLRKM